MCKFSKFWQCFFTPQGAGSSSRRVERKTCSKNHFLLCKKLAKCQKTKKYLQVLFRESIFGQGFRPLKCKLWLRKRSTKKPNQSPSSENLHKFSLQKIAKLFFARKIRAGALAPVLNIMLQKTLFGFKDKVQVKVCTILILQKFCKRKFFFGMKNLRRGSPVTICFDLIWF